jgi:hypothetical protein
MLCNAICVICPEEADFFGGGRGVELRASRLLPPLFSCLDKEVFLLRSFWKEGESRSSPSWTLRTCTTIVWMWNVLKTWFPAGGKGPEVVEPLGGEA